MLMQEIQTLKSELKLIQDRLKVLQDQCTHPKEALWEKFINFDSGEHWIEYKCGICDKFWTKEVK